MAMDFVATRMSRSISPGTWYQMLDNCRKLKVWVITVFPSPTAHYLCTLFAISHSYRSILPASTRLSRLQDEIKTRHGQPGSYCFSRCGWQWGNSSLPITNYIFLVLVWSGLAGHSLLTSNEDWLSSIASYRSVSVPYIFILLGRRDGIF